MTDSLFKFYVFTEVDRERNKLSKYWVMHLPRRHFPTKVCYKRAIKGTVSTVITYNLINVVYFSCPLRSFREF